ncbi:YfaP family protein [Janthinobacterium svalbardensis]|uniref:YfaP family protein n=1 Tax=Janthinobacterium svalbardensis TaxID=368607 RepID=UPI002FCDAF16
MKTLPFYPLCSLLLLPLWTQAQVTIDAPRSGWRNSAGASEEYTQTVNYPAASVNLQPGQAETAQIRGRIAGAIKGKPATLVVNGVAMPMEVGEDGGYGRPYGFGSGSNSVEVRSPDGKSRARTQFVDSYQGKTQARLRIVLSWDSAGTDLDMHVVTPDGGHAWYGNRVLKDGGALDVDVTTGYGPEIFSSSAPVKGNYHVYVNYYGSGENTAMLTVARISFITNEGTPREKLQSFQVPMRAAGELTLVKSFVLP